MGGFNSGRPATKVTVESGLKLDLGRLLRQGLVVPDGFKAGSIVWTYTATGKRRGSIGYEADLSDPYGAYIRLHYSVNNQARDYRVSLRRTPCRFGGYRWWWVCPRTGREATKLYLPPGATVFASRHTFRMAYRSERGGPMDRSHDRQRRIYEKLGDEYRFYEQGPPKRPKGMHRRTYNQLLEQLLAAEEVHEMAFNIGAARILTRDPAMRALLKPIL